MKSSDPGRPSSRRGASGAWNQLKPVREDALESYGLPSKGETRFVKSSAATAFANGADSTISRRKKHSSTASQNAT